MFQNMVVYSEKDDSIGEVVNIDFINNEITAECDDFVFKVEFDDAIILRELFNNGVAIYDRDVLADSNENLYMLELHDDGKLQTHALNESLEIKHSGSKFSLTEELVKSLGELSLVGNYYVLKGESNKKNNFDFNIKIVKSQDMIGDFTYYYACNYKEQGVIDLIKVVFMGSNLLEEEDYSRVTIPYEEYGDYNLVDATPKELAGHVFEMMNNDGAMNYSTTCINEECDNCDCSHSEDSCGADDCCGDRDNCDEYCDEYCEICDNKESECDCSLW